MGAALLACEEQQKQQQLHRRGELHGVAQGAQHCCSACYSSSASGTREGGKRGKRGKRGNQAPGG